LILILVLGLSSGWMPQPTRAARPAASAQAETSPSPELLGAIDRYVAEQLKALRIPGAALAIVHGDQIVHLSAIGAAEGAEQPMTAQTFLKR
jgi:CubicO group peptidase (beta-lactamase class C family)